MRVLIAGDMHADSGSIQRLGDAIDRVRPDEVWQCGDLGYWPRSERGAAWLLALNDMLDHHHTTLYFADGNHEDHDLLNHEYDEPYKAHGMPRVWHCPRGSIRDLDDGESVMFIGGARSVDRIYRREGVTWFINELPNLPERERVLAGGECDFVVAHDVPHLIDLNYPPHDEAPWPIHDLLVGDEFRRWLGVDVMKAVSPRLWFGGHHHVRKTAVVDEIDLTVHVMASCEFNEDLWLAVLDTETQEVTNGV